MQPVAIPRMKETDSLPVRGATARRRIKSPNAPFHSVTLMDGPNIQRQGPSAQHPPIVQSLNGSRFATISVVVMANLIAAALIIYLASSASSVRESGSMAGSIRTAMVAPPLSNKQRDADTLPVLPVLSLPARLEARVGEKILFPISLDGTDGVPARSSIVVSGLPLSVALSEGRLIGDRWNLKADEIGDLHLFVLDPAGGNADLHVQLIGPDGQVIATAETTLAVLVIPETAPSPIQDTQDTQGNPELTTLRTENSQELGQGNGKATPSPPETGSTVQADPAPSASDQAAKKDNSATWIAVTFVNLRERPNSSAPVVGVVSKGAKVNVVGREHGWMQVTTAENSKGGWIYSRFLKSETGLRAGTRKKRAAPPKSPSGSFWKSLSQWLNNP